MTGEFVSAFWIIAWQIALLHRARLVRLHPLGGIPRVDAPEALPA